MPQDYNVDDILEEIRRKKGGSSQPPVQGGGTYDEEPYSPRAPRPARQARPGPRDVHREEPAARRSSYPGGRQPQQPAPDRRSESPSLEYGDSPRRPPRPAGYPGRAPVRRQESPYQRPVSRQQFDDVPQNGRPAAGARERFSFDVGEPQEPRARQGFGDRTLGRTAEPPREKRQQAFDFDTSEEPRRMNQQQPAPEPERPDPAYRDGPADGFTFQADAPSGLLEDDFALPSFDDGEPEEPAWDDPGFGVAPEDIPIPDGTRMDLPRVRRAPMPDSGYTQELEPPAPDRRVQRREAPPESRMVQQSGWKQSMAAQELLGQQEPAEDDFSSPEDAPIVAKDIKSIRIGLTVRLVLTGFLSILSFYLVLSMKVLPFAEQLGLDKNFLLPLPTAIAPEVNMRLFLIVNLVVCVLGAIVCSNIVGGGILSLVKLRADNDSPAALAVLAVLIQGIVLAVIPDALIDNPDLSLYFPVALFALFFNLIGKKMLIRRVERNFNFLISDAEKYAFLQVRNRDFSRELSRGLGADVDRVAYTAKTDFITGFLDRSYSSDYSEQFSRLVSPIVLALALAVSVVSGVLAKDAASAITAFAGLVCITAPFSGAIVPQVMLARMSKRLTRHGAMIPGYEAAEDYSETNAVIISDKDLFAGDSVMLHGMKVFAEKRIDEAILDAASVILSCDGIMSGVFLNMVGGNRRMLKKVDSLIYEDGMGLSAWVDGKRVLIGSQELMRCHGIDCPSKDFESRYARDGRQVLYIANSGELSAMFVVSYNAAPEVMDTLLSLERRGVSLIVNSTDPNVTPELLSLTFGIKRTHVRILPAKLQSEYAVLSQPKEKVNADGCYAGGLRGMSRLLSAAAAIRGSVMHGTIVQLIGIIAGYGLVTFMAFTGSLASASYGVLILFNLALLAVSWVSALVVKK
ncbi:hypothetical protein [Anaerotruncus rubiinfantis]|uniref:hypothetical protein n=1 Tax=Anaerotruncus rubiinfantis TaxID=1720200 RepID=UPI0034A471A2